MPGDGDGNSHQPGHVGRLMNPASAPVHVVEVFGPTVQGEGPNVGRPAVFVRLGGCNLTCAACDTPYTWDGSRFNLRREITPTPAGEVVADVTNRSGDRVGLVVVTGGEPLLHRHQPGFRHMVVALRDGGSRVQVETNGTLRPPWWMVDSGVSFVVSPKLVGPLATDPQQRRLDPGVLAVWADHAHTGQAVFKFVVATPGDVDEVARFATRWALPRHLVWVMPAGATRDEALATGQAIADRACHHGLPITPRLHLLLWPGDTRGR